MGQRAKNNSAEDVHKPVDRRGKHICVCRICMACSLTFQSEYCVTELHMRADA
jgi:hypothetical protein